MKLKGGITYYFAIPLQGLDVKSIDFLTTPKYGFCSFYYPDDLVGPNEFIYTIKVYDFFSETFPPIEVLTLKTLLFGESRYYPFIPTRGEMKWVLIHQEEGRRKLSDFPDLKQCSLNRNQPPSERNWWRLPHCGLNPGEYYKKKCGYDEISHLEFSYDLAEIGVKYRIYIEQIKRYISFKNITLKIEDWKYIMYDILSEEPSLKRVKLQGINDPLIENYIYDYVGLYH